jgi:hypothetical protein
MANGKWEMGNGKWEMIKIDCKRSNLQLLEILAQTSISGGWDKFWPKAIFSSDVWSDFIVKS